MCPLADSKVKARGHSAECVHPVQRATRMVNISRKIHNICEKSDCERKRTKVIKDFKSFPCCEVFSRISLPVENESELKSLRVKTCQNPQNRILASPVETPTCDKSVLSGQKCEGVGGLEGGPEGISRPSGRPPSPPKLGKSSGAWKFRQ